jgi:hypothetical protein
MQIGRLLFSKKDLKTLGIPTAFSTLCGSSAGNQLLSPHADIWGSAAPFSPTKGKPTGRIPHLTPLILVRIQVPQPQNLSILLRIFDFYGRQNIPDTSAS